MEGSEEQVESKLIQAVQERETNPEAAREFLEAALNNMLVVTDGSLWQKNSISMQLHPYEDLLPYGTYINFIPVHGSEGESIKGMFTISKEFDNPAISSSVFIEGRLTDQGHKLTDTPISTWDMNEEQILYAIGKLSIELSKHQKSSYFPPLP